MSVMAFVGALYKDEECFDSALKMLKDLFGDTLYESLPTIWRYSDYYNEELGSPLKRRFIFFKRQISQDAPPEIKKDVMSIEAKLSKDGKRTINLDPGYMTLSKVVLSTRKDYSHRVCIGNGLFAEVTLIYSRKSGFEPTRFTYPDYRSPETLALFNKMRETLKGLLT